MHSIRGGRARPCGARPILPRTSNPCPCPSPSPGRTWRSSGPQAGASPGRASIVSVSAQQGLDLLGLQLPELPSREVRIEGQRAEARSQHPAHERAVSLEELPNVLAARAFAGERVPPIGPIAARGLAALHLEHGAAIELAGENALQLADTKLSADPDTELARQASDQALKRRSQLAVRGDELEATVDARHRAHCDEAPARSARQALEWRGNAP